MKKNLKVIRFLLFLLSNGALVSFFKNWMFNQGKFNEDKSVLKAMSFVRKYVESGDTLFYGAFVFQKSKEGHYYWDKLCEKWEAKLRQINKTRKSKESLKHKY